MNETVFQYGIAFMLLALSAHDFIRQNWHGAFYFLLAAGLFALWIELRNGCGKIEYFNCSWFMNPPPLPPETGKENPEDDRNGK